MHIGPNSPPNPNTSTHKVCSIVDEAISNINKDGGFPKIEIFANFDERPPERIPIRSLKHQLDDTDKQAIFKAVESKRIPSTKKLKLAKKLIIALLRFKNASERHDFQKDKNYTPKTNALILFVLFFLTTPLGCIIAAAALTGLSRNPQLNEDLKLLKKHNILPNNTKWPTPDTHQAPSEGATSTTTTYQPYIQPTVEVAHDQRLANQLKHLPKGRIAVIKKYVIANKLKLEELIPILEGIKPSQKTGFDQTIKTFKDILRLQQRLNQGEPVQEDKHQNIKFIKELNKATDKQTFVL